MNFYELMDLCRFLGAKVISDEAFGFLVSKCMRLRRMLSRECGLTLAGSVERV